MLSGALLSSMLLHLGGWCDLSFSLSSDLLYLVLSARAGAISEGELMKCPHAWSSLADSKAPFLMASLLGLDTSFRMMILSWVHGSAKQGGIFNSICLNPH